MQMKQFMFAAVAGLRELSADYADGESERVVRRLRRFTQMGGGVKADHRDEQTHAIIGSHAQPFIQPAILICENLRNLRTTELVLNLRTTELEGQVCIRQAQVSGG